MGSRVGSAEAIRHILHLPSRAIRSVMCRAPQAWRRQLIEGAALILVAASCSKQKTAEARCLPLAPELAADLNIVEGAAWEVRIAPTIGVANKGRVWFVSSKSGATWVSSQDPTRDASGVVLPLNAKARTTSELGTDAKPGVPMYSGLDDSDPGAIESRRCAGASTQ